MTSISKVSWAGTISNGASYYLGMQQHFYDWITDSIPTLTDKAKRVYTKVMEDSPVAEPLKKVSKKLPKCPKRCSTGVNCLVNPVVRVYHKIKNCFVATAKKCSSQSLYKSCKSVKKFVAPNALREPCKFPDRYKEYRVGQLVGYVYDGIEEAGTRGFKVIYYIADTGEKANATILFLGEMAPQIRPSLTEHLVDPVFADLNRLIAGPEEAPAGLADLLLGTARSVAGDVVEEKGKKLVNQYLESKETEITQLLTNLGDAAQTKASGYLYLIVHEGARYIVVPIIAGPLLKFALSRFIDIGYLETFNTVMIALTYLKYVKYFTWAKKLYELHDPKLLAKVSGLLRKSLSKKSDLDPPKKITAYPDVISQQYNLQSLIQTIKDSLPKGLKESDSPFLRSLNGHVQNFSNDIKDKSNTALRKYDLIGSPTVEEIFADELPDVFEDCTEYSDLTTIPTSILPPESTELKSLAESDASPSIFSTLTKTVAFAGDARALFGSAPAAAVSSMSVISPPKSEVKGEEKSAALSLVSLFDGAVGLYTHIGHSKSHTSSGSPPHSISPESLMSPPSPRKTRRSKMPDADPDSILSAKKAIKFDKRASSSHAAETPLLEAPSAELKPLDVPHEEPKETPDAISAFVPLLRKVAEVIDERTSSSTTAATPPPKAHSADRKPVDETREEPKETPSEKPSWIRRAAVVTIVAGAALLIGVKILSRYSLIPASVPKFSIPTNLEDSQAMKILSSLAEILLRIFKSSRVESAPASQN